MGQMSRKEKKAAADLRREEYYLRFLGQMQDFLKTFSVRDSLIKMDKIITDVKRQNQNDVSVIDFATSMFTKTMREVLKSSIEDAKKEMEEEKIE